MARLTLLLAILALWATPARGQGVDTWSPHIREASARFGVPETWIRRVMRAESNGMTRLNGRPIVSRAGAMGLMQLMPATWASLRARLGLGSDPHDPRDNILAGTFYLRMMYDRFGYPGLFAAYNAGPGRYARSLATGRRLPSETLSYVAAVTDRSTAIVVASPVAARGTLAAAVSPRAESIFVVRSAEVRRAMPTSVEAARNPLFIVRPMALPPQVR